MKTFALLFATLIVLASSVSLAESSMSAPQLAQLSSINCGIKPIPPIGHSVGRCVNGKWEFVSNGPSSSLSCGIKPIPPIGHTVGRCVNGKWEFVSNGSSRSLNCGIKPIPPIGYKIGRCVNGKWEFVSN